MISNMRDNEIRKEIFRTPGFAEMTYLEIMPIIEWLEKLNEGLDKVDNSYHKPGMRDNQVKENPESCKYNTNCKEKLEVNRTMGQNFPICSKHYKQFRTKRELEEKQKKEDNKVGANMVRVHGASTSQEDIKIPANTSLE